MTHQLLFYSISMNIASIVSCMVFYYTTRINKHEIPLLFMFYQTLFTIPVIAWGFPILQDVLITITVFMLYYMYKTGYNIDNKYKVLVPILVTSYTIYRHIMWKGDQGFILFYIIASTIYTIIWIKDPFPIYGLKTIYSLSMISDMREIIYIYNVPLHWLLHTKPIAWLLLLPLILRIEKTRIKWENIVLSAFFLTLSNILDYATLHGIIHIARYTNITISELIVRGVSIPAPIILIRNKKD